MQPVNFEEQTTVFAENQPEYLALPAFKDADGQVITCWKMSWAERLRALFTGRLWLRQLTFNGPLQPQLLQVEYPFEDPAKNEQ